MFSSLLEKSSLKDGETAIIAILVIIVMVLVLSLRRRSKKRKKKIMEAYLKKSREEELDSILRNEEKEEIIKENRPYEISYEDSGLRKNTSAIKHKMTSAIRVIVTVKSEYSTKKYLIEVSDQISIGRNKTNEIVIDDKSISDTHCYLFNGDGLLYAYDAGSTNGTALIRKKKGTKVGSNPIRMREGDKLVLAKSIIGIEFV